MKNSLLNLTLLTALSFSMADAATVSEITQFTTSGESGTIHVATDNHDNFIAAYNDRDTVFGVFSEGGTQWSAPVQLSATGSTFDGPEVAMDQTSTGLAIFTELNAGIFTTQTSFFNNGIWTPIVTPLETSSSILDDPSIAMNGNGKAVAAWVNLSLDEIHASLFSGGVWTPFQVIGTGNNGTKVAYSPSGIAVAAWTHFDIGISNLWANIFNGTSWIGPTLLDNTVDSFPDDGIDAAGNAFVIWRGDSGTTIKVSRFNGTSWLTPPVILSTTASPRDPHIAVDLDGTAIAVFINSPDVIMMSQFNGSSWSTPTPIASGTEVNITMDDRGDALITWVTTLNQLFSALLPKGGTLLNPVFVRLGTRAIENVDPALSSLSTLASLVWNEGVGGEEQNSFGTFIAFGPTPPTNIEGATCVVRSISGNDRVNVISWTPSTDPTVVAYLIFRDGVLIAIVPATGPFIFFDHNRCKGVPSTYSVVAVNAEGIQSAPISVTLD